ncbi:DUF5348 domain-containing protein [Alicyclobacillus acidiphilus]|uniref:DUF5348 domain-containing protein n=1 Tax=Alicyclobacillus acidiphilus TaxID=182455 RepID=UPI00082F2FDE|nr:DUF5348 domain-containing protein [Alicyclobacillus acidiphilus]
MHRSRLSYQPNMNRWVVTTGTTDYGLHCGETFELLLGRTRFPCRLEMADSWYVVIADTTLALRQRETYTIYM